MVTKKIAKRMAETAKRTAYLKQRRENTARRMKAAAVAALRPPEPEKVDAESLLPRQINNKSVVDM